MTAVDHAELKRLAEGASAFNYDGWMYQAPSDPMFAGRIMASEHGPVIATVQWPVPMMDHVLSGVDSSRPVGAFIAAANPAVVLELLSEIEGLKAERDADLQEMAIAARNLQSQREELFALRTQAPDSWRPIADHDNSADEVLVTVEGRRKPIVAWRHHPSSRTDKWLSVPGNYRVYPTAFHPLPALRPQTAESGE